jgi:hypothetical protein
MPLRVIIIEKPKYDLTDTSYQITYNDSFIMEERGEGTRGHLIYHSPRIYPKYPRTIKTSFSYCASKV